MDKVLYFDICALIFMVLLLVSIFLRGLTMSKGSRCFIVTIVCCILTVACELLFEVFGVWLPITPNSFVFRKVMLYGYCLFQSLTVLCYMMYLVCLVDNWYRLRAKPIRAVAMFFPFVVTLGFLILNPWTGGLFYFDSDLVYHRGPAIAVMYVCAGLYFLYSVYYVAWHRKLFSVAKLVALYSLVGLMVIAAIVQYFVPALLVEGFASALAVMLILTVVQRPEENINPVIHVLNPGAFTFSIKRAYYNAKPFSVIWIKLANYTTLLSTLGYDTHVWVLSQLADKLRGCISGLKVSGAEVYFLESGVFGVVVSGKGTCKTSELAQAFQEVLHTQIPVGQTPLTLGAHICIARCPEDLGDFETFDTFGTLVDISEYPENSIILARDIVQDPQFRLKSELSSIINRGLCNNSFEVYYQPIYSVDQQRFTSAEALVRLRDEVYGMVSPALFIPEAEKNGSIHSIGEFVFEEVCRFITSPEFTGLGLDYIEINLSVAQCMQVDLVQKLQGIVDRYQVDPKYINLEITETAVERVRDLMVENLDALHSLGFHFSLDDYGTGYSNIQRIVTLPLNLVKVDKCFVDKYTDGDTRIILDNTIRMLKGLRLKIVVEGVETSEQLEFFTQLQCEHIQGYYFSKPLPRDEFVQFIRNKHLVAVTE